ncbi:hypothetical protein R70199_08055 [Paraburkholderia domus]|nr:hypothetical protein R70199_08055 [Paraburkholderia domus]
MLARRNPCSGFRLSPAAAVRMASASDALSATDSDQAYTRNVYWQDSPVTVTSLGMPARPLAAVVSVRRTMAYTIANESIGACSPQFFPALLDNRASTRTVPGPRTKGRRCIDEVAACRKQGRGAAALPPSHSGNADDPEPLEDGTFRQPVADVNGYDRCARCCPDCDRIAPETTPRENRRQ